MNQILKNIPACAYPGVKSRAPRSLKLISGALLVVFELHLEHDFGSHGRQEQREPCLALATGVLQRVPQPCQRYFVVDPCCLIHDIPSPKGALSMAPA